MLKGLLFDGVIYLNLDCFSLTWVLYSILPWHLHLTIEFFKDSPFLLIYGMRVTNLTNHCLSQPMTSNFPKGKGGAAMRVMVPSEWFWYGSWIYITHPHSWQNEFLPISGNCSHHGFLLCQQEHQCPKAQIPYTEHFFLLSLNKTPSCFSSLSKASFFYRDITVLNFPGSSKLEKTQQGSLWPSLPLHVMEALILSLRVALTHVYIVLSINY